MPRAKTPKKRPMIDDFNSLTADEIMQLYNEPNWQQRLTPNAQRQRRNNAFGAIPYLLAIIGFCAFVFAQCTTDYSRSPWFPSSTPAASECARVVSVSTIGNYLTSIEPNVYGSKDGFALLDTVVIAKVRNEQFDQRFYNVTLSSSAWDRIVTVADLMTELDAALCATGSN